MLIRLSLAAICAAMLISAPVAAKEKTRSTPAAGHEQVADFTCSGILGPDTTEAAIRAHFGDANVVTGTIYGAEGMEMLGTTIFPGQDGKSIEVIWFDEKALEYPASVSVPEGAIAPGGLRIGQAIDEVEALNGAPFKLGGFWWDYGGFAYFEDGTLMQPHPKCYVAVRFSPGDFPDSIDTTSVAGDVELESSLPLLDEIDTRVTSLVIHYHWPEHIPAPEY